MVTATKTKDRWVKRWQVPKSSGEGTWTVAIDREGNYGCSCPIWKFKRQECHHIKLVKMGGGAEVSEAVKPKRMVAISVAPRGKVTIKMVRAAQEKRSAISKGLDAVKLAKRVVQPSAAWLKHPGRYDIRGIDTPKVQDLGAGVVRTKSRRGVRQHIRL